MAGPDAGGGGIGGPILSTVLGGMRLGRLAHRVFGGGSPNIGPGKKEVIREAGGRIVGGTYYLPDIPGIPGQQSFFTNENAAVNRWLRRYQRSGGAQAGTVTPLPPPRSPPPSPPPSSPPPSPDTPPGGLKGEVARQGAFVAAWVMGSAAVDYVRKRAAEAKAKEKARKKKEAAAKKKAEAEARKRALEEKKRRELQYRATYGRAPPTAGRGPITGPWSGNRQYDLPKNPAAPKPPGRTAVDVYVHPEPTVSDARAAVLSDRNIWVTREILRYEGKIFGKELPMIKPGALPKIRPTPLPKGAPWSTPSGAWATAKGLYSQYGKYAGLATLLYGAFAPSSSSKPKRQPGTAPEPLTPPQLGAVELPAQFPQLALATEKAKCRCPKPRKKKRGPRKLRSVCYKGSYVETAKGTRKRKREQIPCQA